MPKKYKRFLTSIKVFCHKCQDFHTFSAPQITAKNENAALEYIALFRLQWELLGELVGTMQANLSSKERLDRLAKLN